MFLSWRKQPWTTGTTLESQISYGLNAPVFFIGPVLARIRFVAVNRAPWFIANYLLYFVLVALLWYAVVLEASGAGGSTIMALLARRRVYRITADVLLVAFGLFLIFLGVMNSSQAFMGQAWHKDIPLVVGFLLWGLLITWFYAHDLYFGTRHQRPHLAS